MLNKRVSFSQTPEPIEMPLGADSWGPNHSANTIERSVLGADAAYCQITSATC